jgi:hypothetical protein
MLETQVGKLKWEQKDQGIRVELPAPLDWPHVSRAIAWHLFLLLIIFLALSFSHSLHESSHHALTNWWFLPTFAPIYVASGILQLWMRRRILTLTPNEMTLNRGIWEAKRNTRVFANRRLHNLRYCASRTQQTAEYESVKDSILCDVEGRTIALMSGISEEEATNLIYRMMEVYKFPKYLDSGGTAPVNAGG